METLFVAKLFRAFTVSHPHTRAHSVVEMSDDAERAGRIAETLEESPQEGAVSIATCFREVDKVDDQRDPLTFSYFLQSANHDHCTDGWVSRLETALLFWQYPFGLTAVVAQATQAA